MFDVTVAQISGIIAALVIVLQFLLPNTLTILLVSLLKEQHTLVTWSVVQRNLLTSIWPVALRTDSSASKGVDVPIRLLTYIRPLGLGLITVAAIVTPLGLHEAVVADRNLQHLPMRYVADRGPMGYGTPVRSGQGFTRSCGDFGPLQCPGTTVIIQTENTTYGPGNWTVTSTIVNDDYDMRIPEVLADLYQSGLSQQSASVSSFFDIDTRLYGFDDKNQETPYIVDAFRYLTSVVLNNKLEPVEGLIVDTVSGGIGFRNHTVPIFSGLRADWQEDLLWIEPETVCVNTNLTLEMTVPYGGVAEPLNITLIDEGGFVNINHTYPECPLDDTQRDPQLYCRAHKAAWMTSVYSMLIMNITRPNPGSFSYLNSHLGARFPLTKEQTSGASLQGIFLSLLFDGLVSPDPAYNSSLEDTPDANYTNPFDITSSDFSDISLICHGAGGTDYANITNIMVSCGLLFGAPYPADDADTLVFQPGSVYRQPVYSCASTNKASIKTVHLQYNATDDQGDSLDALHVVNVTAKQYGSMDSMPIWGVESVDFTLGDLQQLWGLIDDAHVNAVNLSMVRQDHLYLPGYSAIIPTSVYSFDHVPGVSGPTAVLEAIYGSYDSPTDYTGATNMAMYSRWRDLSRDAATAPTMINLIWTDLAANLLLGTRSWNTATELPTNLQKRDVDSTSSDASAGSNLVPITVYRSAVRYNWYYGIPAVFALALVAIIVITAFLTMLIQRGTPSQIKHYLFHLSAGRMMASKLYPAEHNSRMPTKQWILSMGRQRYEIQRGGQKMKATALVHMDQKTAYLGHQTNPYTSSDIAQPLVQPSYQSHTPHMADQIYYGKGYIQVNSNDMANEANSFRPR